MYENRKVGSDVFSSWCGVWRSRILNLFALASRWRHAVAARRLTSGKLAFSPSKSRRFTFKRKHCDLLAPLLLLLRWFANVRRAAPKKLDMKTRTRDDYRVDSDDRWKPQWIEHAKSYTRLHKNNYWTPPPLNKASFQACLLCDIACLIKSS